MVKFLLVTEEKANSQRLVKNMPVLKVYTSSILYFLRFKSKSCIPNPTDSHGLLIDINVVIKHPRYDTKG